MNNDFIEFLNKKNCFKLILGAGNTDCASIKELIQIYSKAGCKFFDIAASKEVYKTLINELKSPAFICMSVGVSDDIHFSKCKINKILCKNCGKCKLLCNQNAINDDYLIDEKKCIGCKKCKKNCPKGAISTYQKQDDWDFDLLKKADCVEFHISTKNKKEIISKWKSLLNNYDGVVSICLNRKYFSDNKLIKILSKMLKIKNKNIIIQADGNPMSGGVDEYSSTLQALGIGELIKKNFSDIPVLLSGGTNSKTSSLAKMFNIDITGVAIGSYARKIVQSKTTDEEKLKAARELIESVENV